MWAGRNWVKLIAVEMVLVSVHSDSQEVFVDKQIREG